MEAFINSRGYVMSFQGEFSAHGVHHDANHIDRVMLLWNHEILGGGTVFPDVTIKAAFTEWQEKEKARIERAAYQHVAFDKGADPSVLTRFAALITAPTEGDEAKTARDARATEVALMNFIYRVKNHMRKVWRHGVHMMPILYGPQGSGKTTIVDHLLSPLEEFKTGVGFNMFDDRSQSYRLSVMPIMVFDEMAGITKADNERLKDIMHARSRQLRDNYMNATTRILVSTFIGCTNKDISTLIRDETGNRRFFQIDTPPLSREAIRAFDPLVMWRSVNEDAEPPLYANHEALNAVQVVQREQRHIGHVEHWIDEATHTHEWLKASDMFLSAFLPWLQQMYPGQDRFWDAQKFGRELSRLIRESHPRIGAKFGKTSKLYLITDVAEEPDFPPPPPEDDKVVVDFKKPDPKPEPARERDYLDRAMAKTRTRDLY